MEHGKIPKFLEKKWRQGFQFFDVNKDGFLSKEDLQIIAEHLCLKKGIPKCDEVARMAEINKWYDLLLPKGEGPIVEDSYVSGCARLYQRRDELVQLNVTTASNVFDCLDLNKDGIISQEELTTFYQAVGITNANLSQEVFRHLDRNGDGCIERREFISDWVDHFTNPDPKHGQSYLISLGAI